MRDIKEEIARKLTEIEEKEKVQILYAVESGSRAWGVASPDSDYDVRFIYVRTKKDYLSIQEKRDVIEWQLDDVLDINGWDLKKHLSSFTKGTQHFLSGQTRRLFTKLPTNGKMFMKAAGSIFPRKQRFIIIMELPAALLSSICKTKRLNIKSTFMRSDRF